MTDTILRVELLEKKFKNVHAVKGISFEVKRGQVFGILGPNGSGKTTTIAMLLGILKPTNGSFSWFSNGNAAANRLRMGALLETPNFYPYLNAYDNLMVVAKIKEIPDAKERIKTILTRVDLGERGKRPFRTYSLGMKQRLAVAAALLSDPEVLVLDEPTNGLDPMGIIEMRDLISAVAQEGKTIIIASHILDEIEKICTHFAIMKEGSLLSTGALSDLLKQSERFLLKAENMEQLRHALQGIESVTVLEHEDNSTILAEANGDVSSAELNRLLAQQGIYLSQLSPYRKSLETVFIETVQP